MCLNPVFFILHCLTYTTSKSTVESESVLACVRVSVCIYTHARVCRGSQIEGHLHSHNKAALRSDMYGSLHHNTDKFRYDQFMIVIHIIKYNINHSSAIHRPIGISVLGLGRSLYVSGPTRKKF